MESLFIVILTFGGMAGLIAYGIHRSQVYQARIKRLMPPNTIFDERTKIRTFHPSHSHSQPIDGHLFISDKRIVFYSDKDDVPIFDCTNDEIEGFWRPQKYQDGMNTIELHANVGGQWTILRTALWKSRMESLVRALKSLVNDDTIRAYRQRRPYIFHAPAAAHLAKQDIYGAWELGTLFKLYLMPSALVFLSDGDMVERTIKLRDIQNIKVLKRLDTDEDSGLVCFKVVSSQETMAIAIQNYEAWAEAAAIAAKRTLEDPIVRKRKAYEDTLDEDADWSDSTFDEALWDAQKVVLGYDGEFEIMQ